jgi:hypothetical protein
MKPPPSHKPFLILAGAVTLMVILLYSYMYWQVNVSVGKAVAAREIARAHKENQSRQVELVRLHDQTVEDRQKLAGYFIPRDETVEFIEAIESIGPQSGSEVELSDIDADPLAGAKPGTRGEIKAHIEARGSWASVMKTLMVAERLPYKLAVNDIRLQQFSPDPRKKPSGEWTLSFNIIGSIIVAVPATRSIP